MHYIGAEHTRQLNNPYLSHLQEDIDALEEAINSYAGNGNPQLKGFIAEAWHTYTFNINAAAKQSTYRATQDVSNNLGSVDISTNWGEEYSLKYCKDGGQSAFYQGHPLEWAYQRYINRLPEGSKIPSREEYLIKNGIDPKIDMSLGMYEGQARLIPSDQIADAIKALEKRISKELNNLDNPERVKVAERLIQVKDKLTSHLSSPDGVNSIGLTEPEAREIAKLAKEGKFDPARYDITLAKKSDLTFLCNNALKAGYSAAWVSALIKICPNLVVVMKTLLKEGYINPEDLKNIGKNGASGAADGFIKGVLCGFISDAAQLGKLGDTMKTVAATDALAPIIASIVVFVSHSISDSIKYSNGEITSRELVYNIQKDMFITGGSLAGGLALQYYIPIPLLSYSIGSFVGGLLGGLVFSAREEVMMSLCVEQGYTFLGLVDQDYTLPKELRRKLGLPVYDFEEYKNKEYKYKEYHPSPYNWREYKWKEIECILLKRGIISCRKVGYV